MPSSGRIFSNRVQQSGFGSKNVVYLQWRLQDFFVGGAKGGLNRSEGVLKLIQLRENNERLSFSYQLFIYSSFKKGIFCLFSVVINFSYATVISNNANCQT